MKTQVSAVSLALSVAALVTTSHAFASISSGNLRAASSVATPLHLRDIPSSSTSLNAAIRDRETALNAVLLETEEVVSVSSSEVVDLSVPDVAAEAMEPQEDEKAYLKDGFVFGLEGSGLERPQGKVANIVVEGDSLETQTYQVAMVAGTFLAHAGFATVNYMDLLAANGGNVVMASVQTLVLLVASWLLADLGSGVLHWSVDNYGNGKTPIMGGIIAAFQGHHSAPWTITERGFCNNVYKLCIPFGVVPMTVINFLAGPAVTLFFTFFCVAEIMSQEFHKWSHMTKGQCPAWVNTLQSVGLTVGRKPHAQHHLAPYDGNYCIISGIWNNALDESGIFRWMEHMIYNMNGVESNAWKLDAELRERTLRGDYGLPPTAASKSA
ncbi:acid desaturase 4-like [Seminavis robusta]|uniref:Acid desaturase 4-like n=1 Tax=Seminavis robusta TaxID=568900 RepID=A0A9N8DHW8_9STRA|nr:acid desaturase 4-like [Seminavis robusta]|eukprot:Sro167_g074390.1 acid desaturase 4-like (382) ;mRNA; r:26341-27486